MPTPSPSSPFFARRLAALVVTILLAVVGVAAANRVLTNGSKDPGGTASAPGRAGAKTRTATLQIAPGSLAGSTRLVVRRIGVLPTALQDAATTSLGGSVIAAGGLDARDVSTSPVRRIDGAGGVANIARVPFAVHDAAAATIGPSAFLFGGGDGTRQHGEILQLLPGRVRTVGRLPAPASDAAAAVIGSTAYIVGGFDGRRALDTVVAWAPGRAARVVGHLPSPLRYAAVAAAGRTLVIAGGSRPDGTATNAILGFDPATGAVHRIGRLPAQTTHAAAATLGKMVIVIGGRGPSPDTPSDRIVAVDPRAGPIRTIGRLPTPLSDLGVATIGSHVVILGGRDATGPRRTLLAISISRRVGATSPAAAPRPRAAAGVYAFAGRGDIATEARRALPRIYVPNSIDNTVDVIDPASYRVVDHFAVGALPQHVTPSWDLKTLWVDNDKGNSLTPINPRTGKAGPSVPVQDPYNLYFTPDGRSAIVVAEAQRRLDFRDPHTMKLQSSLPVPCRGVDHMDMSADGRFSLASCEFSGSLIVIDLVHRTVVKQISLPRAGAMPQDVKLAPSGRTFYVADMASGGVWRLRAADFSIAGFLPTGRGAHGLYPSRDARFLYVSNRDAGSVSVVSFASDRVIRTWKLPGHATPDMGGVSADGGTLWLSGRYSAEVYAINTQTGRLRARIAVGKGPHGLSVWPQPGRYSLGHTGILR